MLSKVESHETEDVTTLEMSRVIRGRENAFLFSRVTGIVAGFSLVIANMVLGLGMALPLVFVASTAFGLFSYRTARIFYLRKDLMDSFLSKRRTPAECTQMKKTITKYLIFPKGQFVRFSTFKMVDNDGLKTTNDVKRATHTAEVGYVFKPSGVYYRKTATMNSQGLWDEAFKSVKKVHKFHIPSYSSQATPKTNARLKASRIRNESEYERMDRTFIR